MNLLSVIGGLVAGVPAAVADYFNTKQKLKTAEAVRKLELEDAIHQRKIELIRTGLAADANWEMEFARQAASSWKDEYTLIVISIPAILSFIPTTAQYVKDGFAALQQTPLWYQVAFLSLFLATVGIRYWRRSQSDT